MKHTNCLSAFVLLFAFAFFTHTPLQVAQATEREMTDLKPQSSQAPPASQASNTKKPFFELLKEGLQEVQKAAGKELVLFLGPTGVGKSTTINYLLGHTMCDKSTDDPDDSDHEYNIDAVDKEAMPYAEVGHEGAQTTYPTVYSTAYHPLTYCDCPGFFDTRGDDYELYGPLVITQAIQASKGVKALVFCMGTADIKAARGTIFTDMVKVLSQMLGAPILNLPSIFILFTKEPKDKLEKYCKKLEKRLKAIQKETQAPNPAEDNLKVETLLASMLDRYNRQLGQNLFSVNPLDRGESRNQIIHALVNSSLIPRQAFGFVGTPKMLKECKTEFITPFVKDSMPKFTSLLDKEAIRRALLQERIAMYEGMMTNLEQLPSAKGKIRKATQQNIGTGYDKLIEINNQSIATLKRQNISLRERIKGHDTSEFILYAFDVYDEQQHTWGAFYGRKARKKGSSVSYQFSYEDLPFVKVDTNKYKGRDITKKDAAIEAFAIAAGGLGGFIAGAIAGPVLLPVLGANKLVNKFIRGEEDSKPPQADNIGITLGGMLGSATTTTASVLGAKVIEAAAAGVVGAVLGGGGSSAAAVALTAAAPEAVGVASLGACAVAGGGIGATWGSKALASRSWVRDKAILPFDTEEDATKVESKEKCSYINQTSDTQKIDNTAKNIPVHGNSPEVGMFVDENKDLGAGIYQLTYKTPLHALGRGEIRIYVKKNLLHQEAIVSWQTAKEKNEKQIRKLQSHNQDLEKRKRGMIKRWYIKEVERKEEVDTLLREKEEYEDKLKQIQVEREQAKNSLKEDKLFFDCVVTVAKSIQTKDALLKEFLANCRAYIGEPQDQAIFVDADDTKELDPTDPYLLQSYYPNQDLDQTGQAGETDNEQQTLLSQSINHLPTTGSLNAPAQYIGYKAPTDEQEQHAKTTPSLTTTLSMAGMGVLASVQKNNKQEENSTSSLHAIV